MGLELSLKPEVAACYKSSSQRARVLTQTWARENLYCPACTSDSLSPTPEGEPIVDFTCPSCDERYQLKSQAHPFGKKISNSAYEPKLRAIRTGTVPNFFFLRYDSQALRVVDLFLVPGHFITESIVERRKPLSDSARRHGWVGSNILLGNLPQDARIAIIENGQEIPVWKVRERWSRFSFLRDWTSHSRGWLADVLACVRELKKREFTLADVYAFEDKLAGLHPTNKHVRPKIRQQLQVLRDNGILEFLGKGVYRVRDFDSL